jgi:hypothetical protein
LSWPANAGHPGYEGRTLSDELRLRWISFQGHRVSNWAARICGP